MGSLQQLAKEVFQFFKDHLVFVVSILIVSASINIKFYYSFLYHFDIIPYISAQELLALSFLSLGEHNLPITVAILLVVALVEVSLNAASTTLISGSFLIMAKKLILNGLLLIPVYEILEFCIFILYTNYIESRPDLLFVTSEAIFAVDISALIVFMFLYYFDFQSIFISSQKVTYVLVILSVISVGTFSNSLKTGLNSKYSKSYSGTKVIVENDTIISNSKFMYIGQTNGYLFHYDFNARKTFVTPMAQVKQIEIVSQAAGLNVK